MRSQTGLRTMPPDRKCQGVGLDGSPCGAPPSLVDPLSGYCYSHDPNREEERKESSRRGGQSTARRFRPPGLTPEELGPLKTVQDAQKWLRLIAEAVGGRAISHSEGTSMTSAVREWLKAEDTRLRAEELKELQEEVKALKRQRGMKAVR